MDGDVAADQSGRTKEYEQRVREEFGPRLRDHGPTHDIIMQIRARVRQYIKEEGIEHIAEPHVFVSEDGNHVVVTLRMKQKRDWS